MKLHEILLEYRRDVTAKAYGYDLVDVFLNRPSDHRLSNVELADTYYDQQKKDWDVDKILNHLFDVFEKYDPTFNNTNKTGGKYIRWIAREYSKRHLPNLGDLERVHDILKKYELYKNKPDFIRNDIGINIKDIMSVDWSTLEKYIMQYGPYKAELEKGKYTVGYEDSDVTVIIPQDLTASKYWAKYGGTEAVWCTRFPDNFEYYTSAGPLYILIPKKPQNKYKRDGDLEEFEKYQLNFPKKEFKDPQDEAINLFNLITVRFPNLYKYFEKEYPQIVNFLRFSKPELIKFIVRSISEYALKIFNKLYSEYSINDPKYKKWLYEEAIDNKYYTANFLANYDPNDYEVSSNDIDWDKVENDPNLSYESFDKNLRELKKFLISLYNSDGKYLKQKFIEQSDYSYASIESIPSFIYYMYRPASTVSNDSSNLIYDIRNIINSSTIDINDIPKSSRILNYKILGQMTLNDMNYTVGTRVPNFGQRASTYTDDINESVVNEIEDSPITKKIDTVLTQSGYRRLGYGADKSVWFKEGENVVGIIMPSHKRLDTAMKSFLRLFQLSQDNPDNNYLPKFARLSDENGNLDYYREFTIDNKKFVQYGMERLYPLRNKDVIDVITMMRKFVSRNLDYNTVNVLLKYYFEKNPTLLDNIPDVKQLYETVKLIIQSAPSDIFIDILDNKNVMQRLDGTPVFVDPYYSSDFVPS